MEKLTEEGIYGKGDVYRFYSVEEALEHKTNCSNWPKIVEEMRKYLGKIWEDHDDIRYLVNSVPVYREYTIIGMEDNEPWADYYWILEDKNKKRKYELANDSDFYKNIKI